MTFFRLSDPPSPRSLPQCTSRRSFPPRRSPFPLRLFATFPPANELVSPLQDAGIMFYLLSSFGRWVLSIPGGERGSSVR